MGVQRLKIKNDLNYRPGYTDRHCSGCDHFVAADRCAEGELWEAARCRVMGVERGRGYRINGNNICDRFDQTRYLERLKGGRHAW
jgi:hypothetical protein